MADRRGPTDRSREAVALYTWLTVRRCAEQIDVSLEYIREEIRSGRLPASDFGRGRVPAYRVRPDDWQAWLREHERKAS